MLLAVGARALSNRDPVMQMAPMGRRHVLGVDAEFFDRVDRFQNPLDLRPTGEAEQDLAAGPHARDRRDRRARLSGAQNVDTDSRAPTWRGRYRSGSRAELPPCGMRF